MSRVIHRIFNTIKALLLLLPTLLLSGEDVATFLPDARAGKTYAFDSRTLEKSVNAHLPMTIEYMYLFEIVLQKAWIRLPKESERISILLDTNVTMTAGSVSRTFLATVDMDSAIQYRAAEASVYLKAPRIHEIMISGMAPETSNYANGMIDSALLAYYKRYPAYQLSVQEKEELDFSVKALSIRGGNVHVTLGEKKVR